MSLQAKRWRGCRHASWRRGRYRDRRRREQHRRAQRNEERRMMRIGVIGYGYWGPNVVRNFSDLAEAQVTVVSDSRPDRLAQAQRRYPGIRVTTDPLDLIADPAVDAVAVVTPVAFHFELASAALRAGAHGLVGKPIAAASDAADRLPTSPCF